MSKPSAFKNPTAFQTPCITSQSIWPQTSSSFWFRQIKVSHICERALRQFSSVKLAKCKPMSLFSYDNRN